MVARYVPSSPPAGIASSERKVWEGFRSLDDGWIVHHGVEWQGLRDGTPDDGEADFVLVHADYGVIVVEVKGGDIEVTPDGWFSINAQGRHEIKNPFKQVQDSKRALIAFLRQRLAPCPRIPFGHLVVFPDVRKLPKLGPEAPDEIAWRQIEIGDAGVAVEALCGHWALDVPIGDDLAAAISGALAPEGSIRLRYSDEVAHINAQIEVWTREQADVLRVFRENERLIVLGGAGTGKTALALDMALECSMEGKRVLLTCFNRPLGEHLRDQMEGVDGITSRHFHKLCTDLAARALDETGDSAFSLPETKSREFWQLDAPTILVEAADALSVTFDVIIVDEGQDFSAEWFEALEALFPAGGSAQWIVFADSHQAIYRNGWQSPFRGATARLSKNCRNTREIASRVSAVWGESTDSQGPFGRPAEFISTESFEGSRRALKSVLHRLVNEGGLAARQVTVLCQKKSQVSALRGERLAGMRLAATRGEDAVLVETIHRFKGLESDVVIVVFDVVLDQDRPIAYTGLSRACAGLYVIGPEVSRAVLNWT